MRCVRASFIVCIAFTLLSSLQLLDAQESASNTSPDGTKSAESKPERRGPLPTYYGQVGVTDEQREKLYDIQDKYEVQLEELRQKLKQVVRERDAAMEELLTPGQKLRIQELRAAAKKRATERLPAKQSKPEAENS